MLHPISQAERRPLKQAAGTHMLPEAGRVCNKHGLDRFAKPASKMQMYPDAWSVAKRLRLDSETLRPRSESVP